MTMTILRIAAWVVAAGVSANALAADVNAGAEKAKQICQACHGLDGNATIADYPKLGGQYRDYLAKALRDYKSGARKNAIMAGMAAPLTDADIDNVAAYYANQPATLDARY
jgi:cytochrome c553